MPLFVYANGRKKKNGGQGNGKKKNVPRFVVVVIGKPPPLPMRRKRKFPGYPNFFGCSGCYSHNLVPKF